MKRFKFKLAGALRVRRKIEKAAERALILARSAEEAAGQNVTAATALNGAAAEALGKLRQPGPLDRESVSRAEAKLAEAEQRLVRAKLEAARARAKTEEAARTHGRAVSDRRTLEAVEDSARARYEIELRREEMRAADEAAGIRFVRASAEAAITEAIALKQAAEAAPTHRLPPSADGGVLIHPGEFERDAASGTATRR